MRVVEGLNALIGTVLGLTTAVLGVLTLMGSVDPSGRVFEGLVLFCLGGITGLNGSAQARRLADEERVRERGEQHGDV